MKEHTPTPWEVTKYKTMVEIKQDDSNYTTPGVPICSWLGFDNCDRPMSEHKANAEYIVHCVNNHDALVETLRKAINYLDVDNLTMQTIEKDLNEVLQEAQL